MAQVEYFASNSGNLIKVEIGEIASLLGICNLEGSILINYMSRPNVTDVRKHEADPKTWQLTENR